MQILDFLGLGEAEQWEEFSVGGIFLAEYKDIDVYHQLYLLYDFYIELNYAPSCELHQNLNAFVKGPRLDKYIAGDIDYIYTDLEIDSPE
ncbi:MAG: hypothetical protein WBG48_02000 [Pricia sp.]